MEYFVKLGAGWMKRNVRAGTAEMQQTLYFGYVVLNSGNQLFSMIGR